ncbi:hypothetical protein [Salisaeta longa]|uniref:hypothetical protein n=1 Tax=Salisaeta longa TaxID=503170 RepID=UPI00048CE352|nr:hypothetical protein [Salisaeta longa]
MPTDAPRPSTDNSVPADEPSVSGTSATASSDVRPIRWIENEGLLRDEGVLLGLAGMSEELAHKIDVIRSYFAQHEEAVRRGHAQLEARHARIEEQIADVTEQLATLDRQIEAPSIPAVDCPDGVGRHTLLRYVVGAVLTLALCGATLVFVHTLLAPLFARAWWVTASVGGVGFFVAFQPTSWMYTNRAAHQAPSDAPEPWKTQLATFGLPVAAALFVSVWTYEPLGALKSISVFVFLAFAFLFGGQLLLSLLPRLSLLRRVLWHDVRVWWARRQARKRRRQLREQTLGPLQDQDAWLQEEKARLRTPATVAAERDACIATLRSEYALARQAIEAGILSARTADQILRTSPNPTNARMD